LTLGVGSASAGQPTTKGCVGASVSLNADLLHPYGQFISTVVAPGGVGDDVHALQAGLIPDAVYLNSCN
jgi:hypothetical protein